MRAVSQHINTISYLEEKTFAAMVVDNQMANVMLANTTPQAREGTQQLAGRTWYWKVTPVKTSNDILVAFDVSVATEKKAALGGHGEKLCGEITLDVSAAYAASPLIEVLVAMAIFASLSLAAYQVLNQVQRSNSLSAEREARLSELQRAVVMMDADFRQDGAAPLSNQWRRAGRKNAAVE